MMLNLAEQKRTYFATAKTDVRRELRDRPSVEVGSPSLLEGIPDDRPTPSTAAMTHERLAQLTAALSELAERDRRAILLRYAEGLSFAEIGQRLDGLSEDGVRKLYGPRLPPPARSHRERAAMTADDTGDRPRPETPLDHDPIAEWAAAYDDALERGEPPPAPEHRPGDSSDVGERERLRDLLHLLHHALRSPGTGAATPEERSATGRGRPSLGRFVVERELGRGGFGVVYLAHDPAMDRRVALKVPCADALLAPGVRRRFLREARAAARLDHPNLVPMYEADEVGPICYIASAYCEGPTLAHWLAARPGPISPRRAARLVHTLALAMAHIHSRGLLHGDLKPGNILLNPSPRPGDDPMPRITDFGLARLIEPAPDAAATATTRPMGTPPYMAPEQIEPRDEGCGPPADVYALGANPRRAADWPPAPRGRLPLADHARRGRQPARPTATAPPGPRARPPVDLPEMPGEIARGTLQDRRGPGRGPRPLPRGPADLGPPAGARETIGPMGPPPPDGRDAGGHGPHDDDPDRRRGDGPRPVQRPPPPGPG